jgi:hypothetical protein
MTQSLRESADKRIAVIKNSGEKGKGLIDTLFKKANEQLVREQRKREQEKSGSERRIRDLMLSGEKKVEYKKKETRDYSHLFDDNKPKSSYGLNSEIESLPFN